MHADLDGLLTTLYVLVDDFLPARTGAGRRPRITAAELITLVVREAFDWLDAPPERVTNLDVPMPYAGSLEALVLPSPERIAAAVRRVLGRPAIPEQPAAAAAR